MPIDPDKYRVRRFPRPPDFRSADHRGLTRAEWGHLLKHYLRRVRVGEWPPRSARRFLASLTNEELRAMLTTPPPEVEEGGAEDVPDPEEERKARIRRAAGDYMEGKRR